MTPPSHLDQEDLALFALQLLPEDELEAVLTHLHHCEPCRQEVGRFQGDLAAYSTLSELHTPPAAARERLMRRVAKEKKVVPIEFSAPASAPHSDTEPMLAGRRLSVLEFDHHEERRTSYAGLAWAGWAVAAGLAVTAGLQFREREQLQSALTTESAKADSSRGDADRAEQALQTLTDAGAMQVALQVPPAGGAAPVREPEGHAAYLPDKGSLVFIASHLKPLEPYKTYELWLLPEGEGRVPIPAGTFKPDTFGNASVIMPVLPKGVAAKGFGVTVEDDGGSKQPTFPIVLAGT